MANFLHLTKPMLNYSNDLTYFFPIESIFELGSTHVILLSLFVSAEHNLAISPVPDATSIILLLLFWRNPRN